MLRFTVIYIKVVTLNVKFELRCEHTAYNFPKKKGENLGQQ